MKIDPCPFCGNTNFEELDDEDNIGLEYISCNENECDATGPHAEDLEDAILKWNERADSEPYLNKDHPHFSEELNIAIAAWTAIYGGELYKSTIAHKKQIKNWLNDEYRSQKDLSESARERIAVMVNSNKSGRATPSGGA